MLRKSQSIIEREGTMSQLQRCMPKQVLLEVQLANKRVYQLNERITSEYSLEKPKKIAKEIMEMGRKLENGQVMRAGKKVKFDKFVGIYSGEMKDFGGSLVPSGPGVFRT